MKWGLVDARQTRLALAAVGLAAPFLAWMPGRIQAATSVLLLLLALVVLSKKGHGVIPSF